MIVTPEYAADTGAEVLVACGTPERGSPACGACFRMPWPGVSLDTCRTWHKKTTQRLLPVAAGEC